MSYFTIFIYSHVQLKTDLIGPKEYKQKEVT